MNTNLRSFFVSIYKWMAIGVLISGVTAWLTINSALQIILLNPILFWGTVAVQLALLFIIQLGIRRLSYQLSFALYILYAVLTGITISGLLLFYLTQSLNLVLVIFGVAVSMFVALAVLGYYTRRDLSGWGTFLFAGVWVVFFSSIANIFLQNTMFDFVISIAALLVFAALTVYDNQFYKNLYVTLQTDEERAKATTLGALHMYINFIMIFQSLLNIVGGRGE